MLQHGTIYLQQEISVDFDLIIGSNPQEISVVRGMVDFTEGNTVRDDGISVWLRVANDVSGVQQFDVH